MRYKYLQIFQTHETMKSSNFDFFQTIVKQKPVEGNYIVNLVLRRSCLWLNLVWFILQDKLCARGWRGHFPRVSSSLAGIALIFVRKFGVGLLTSLTLPSTPAITLNIWLMLLSAILLPFMRLNFCTFILHFVKQVPVKLRFCFVKKPLSQLSVFTPTRITRNTANKTCPVNFCLIDGNLSAV